MKIEENYKPTYREVSLKEWVNEMFDDPDILEGTEEEMFKNFIESVKDLALKEDLKELKTNKKEVIEILKTLKKKQCEKVYDDLVNAFYNAIDNVDIYYDYDIICPDEKVIDKAKREAIIKLYNKYCG